MARRYIRAHSPEGLSLGHDTQKGYQGLVSKLATIHVRVLVEVQNLYTKRSFFFSVDSSEEYEQLRSLQKEGQIEMVKFYGILKHDLGEEVNWRELISLSDPQMYHSGI